MARIKIEDLPVMEDLSEKEIKGIFGGAVATARREITLDFRRGNSLSFPPRRFGGSGRTFSSGAVDRRFGGKPGGETFRLQDNLFTS